MKYLYPLQDSSTHEIINNYGISKNYPKTKSYENLKDYSVSTNEEKTKVFLIRENIGFKNKWSLVKSINKSDESRDFYKQQFYVLTENLKNIGNKKNYSCKYEKNKSINLSALPSDQEELYEVYDNKVDGCYSVKIQLDYAKLIDMGVYLRAVQEAYISGAKIILSKITGESKTEGDILALQAEYYTFAYVVNDIAFDNLRPCEPITFTVSIPMNFFDMVDTKIIPESVSKVNPQIDLENLLVLSFKGNEFVNIINGLMEYISGRSGDVLNYLYPNKRYKNYFTYAELQGLQGFADSAFNLMKSIGFIINQETSEDVYNFYFLEKSNTTENYNIPASINYNKFVESDSISPSTLELVSGMIDSQTYGQVFFTDSFIEQCKNTGTFHNPRIINYLLNASDILQDVSRNKEIEEFIKNYVKYPKAEIEEDSLIDTLDVTSETLEKFKIKHVNDSECFTLGDIVDTVSEGFDVVADLANNPIVADLVGNPLLGDTSALKQKFDLFKSKIGKYENHGFFEKYKKAWGDIKTEQSFVEGYRQSSDMKQANPTVEYVVAPYLGVAESQITPASEDDYQNGFAAFGGAFKESYTNLNKDAAQPEFRLSEGNPLSFLNIFLSRLNWEEIIFSQIYCLLKNSGNSPEFAEEWAEIAADIPAELVQIVKYFRSASKLKGWRKYKYIIDGFSKNIQFCDDEWAYFLKTLSLYVKKAKRAVKAFEQGVETILDTVMMALQHNSRNVWAEIGRAAGKIIFKALVDFIFEFLNDVLTAACDDPLNISPDDFEDPFKPVDQNERFGQEDSEDETSSDAPVSSTSKTDSYREIYGIIGEDAEYVVNVIQKFLQDLRCILSPIESVQLLKGEASATTLTVAKNLIKRKYSKDPENLLFLLEGDALERLFKNLGKNVDQNTINKIEETYEYVEESTGYTYDELCSNETKNVINDLLKDKYPQELDALKEVTAYRLERAKKLLGRLKNPDFTFNEQFLCSDGADEDDDINNFKDKFAGDAGEVIDATFNNTLTVFNSECDKILKPFVEEKQYLRYDPEEDQIFGNINYNTYNTNLLMNLIDINMFPSDLSASFKYNIKNKSALPTMQLAQLLLKTKKESIEIEKCTGKSYEEDVEFFDFLRQGRVFYERRRIPRDYDTSSGELFNFSDNMLEEYGEEFKKSIIHRGSVIVISVDREANLDKDQIWFRHILWDKANKTLRKLYEISYADLNSDDDLEDGDREAFIKQITDNFINSIDTYTLNDLVSSIYKYSDHASIDSEIKDYWKQKKILKILTDSDAEDEENPIDFTYILNEQLIKDFTDLNSRKKQIIIDGQPYQINIADPLITLNVIKEVFLMIKDQFNAIKTYELLTTSLEKYNEIGLFNIRFNNSGSKIDQIKVSVASTNVSGNLVEKEYATIQVPSAYQVTGSCVLPPELVEKEVAIWESIQNFRSDFFFEDSSGSLDIISEVKHPKYPAENKLFCLALSASKELSISENAKYFRANDIKSVYEQTLFRLTKDKMLLDFWFFSGPNEPDNTLEDFLENAEDVVYENFPNDKFVDIWKSNYGKLSGLNYRNNRFYSNCKYVPHYLNLNLFKTQAMNQAVADICDDNLQDIPIKMIDDVLVNLTIRTYVTDFVIKMAPFLALLNNNDLYNIYKDEYIINMIRELMKQEMHIFTIDSEPDSDDDYYPLFLSTKIKPVYKTYEENTGKSNNLTKLNSIYVTTGSENKEIDYFIKKELKRTLDFLFVKRIITPSKTSILDGSEEKKFLYNTLLLYSIMSCTVDAEKRTIFFGTKDELAKIFFSTSILKDAQAASEYPSGPSIVETLTKMAFAESPALFAEMESANGWTYISFILEALFNTTHQILKISSTYQDPLMLVTRIINVSATVISSIGWAFVEPETRQQLKNSAAKRDNYYPAYYYYSRFDQVMSPLAIPYVSADTTIRLIFASFGGFPPPISIAYMIFDTIKEVVWTFGNVQEFNDLQLYLNSLDTEECDVPGTQRDAEPCNEDRIKFILEEEDNLENGLNVYDASLFDETIILDAENNPLVMEGNTPIRVGINYRESNLLDASTVRALLVGGVVGLAGGVAGVVVAGATAAAITAITAGAASVAATGLIITYREPSGVVFNIDLDGIPVADPKIAEVKYFNPNQKKDIQYAYKAQPGAPFRHPGGNYVSYYNDKYILLDEDKVPIKDDQDNYVIIDTIPQKITGQENENY